MTDEYIPEIVTSRLRSETGYGGGGTGPRGGISSFGVMGQVMPNRMGFDQRTSQAFDRDFDPRDAEELRISLDLEKQSLRQKIIAMLRKEGIAEDLINAELAKYPSLEALRNAAKNALSIAATLKKRGLPGAITDTKDAIREGIQGRIEDAQAKFEDAQEFLKENPVDFRGGLLRGAFGRARTMLGDKYGEFKGKVDDTIDRVGDAVDRVTNRADGGIMSLQSGGDVDLRDIAKRRSAEVYGDPVMFERFAPSPLQQMDPSFRQSQFFMPAGQVPNFNMGIMGLPGQMYANYYPAGPVGQMNPINKQIMGMPGGAPMSPPPGSEPPVTAPPPSQDTGMTGEIWDKPYEEAIPKPKRSDFVSGFRKGKKDSEAFKRALEEWNRNQKIWDSFETGAERKKYYLSGLDNLRFADGGSTNFPRKNGQISGPGTERSDDIPAMLSDGEFVVNAKAVRGIGSLMGSGKPKSKAEQRREGARAMYALQSAGEKASGLRG
jgi:hypothetical protein